MLPSGLERLLVDRLGFRLVRAAPIDPGQAHNNRLVHLWSADGRQAVAKCYFQDDRQRLDREYTAIGFLHAHGVTEVPQPYLRDDASGVAVYSFEPGHQPQAVELTSAHVQALASIIARLHHLGPATPGAHFRPSVAATFSLADQVGAIRRRLAEFEQSVASPAVSPSVRAFVQEVPIAAELERLIGRALRGLDADAISARVPDADWRLTTGDLAPHNLLVEPDGGLRIVDLEYSGWDDPAIPLADFLAHESSRTLAPAWAAMLEQAVVDLAGLAPREVRRGRRVRALLEVGWLAVHLSLLVPARLGPKQFADPRFDLAAHLAQHIQRFRARLATIDDLLEMVVTT